MDSAIDQGIMALFDGLQARSGRTIGVRYGFIEDTVSPPDQDSAILAEPTLIVFRTGEVLNRRRRSSEGVYLIADGDSTAQGVPWPTPWDFDYQLALFTFGDRALTDSDDCIQGVLDRLFPAGSYSTAMSIAWTVGGQTIEWYCPILQEMPCTRSIADILALRTVQVTIPIKVEGWRWPIVDEPTMQPLIQRILVQGRSLPNDSSAWNEPEWTIE